MNLRISLIIFFLFTSSGAIAQKELVKVLPLNPEIGQRVTIIFVPPVVAIATPELVFSYSNFFEMPNALPMVKKGENWEASFVVPRYAKYASFYIKQGNLIYKIDNQNHYEIIFYKDGKPVFDTYLYKSYSMATQMGKSDSTKIRVNQLIAKELEIHPDNYAAKLNQLANAMAQDKPNAKAYLKSALEIIDKKLNENPTDMGNINQVTMGYLIIGENARMDTLKTYIKQKYPNSEVAFEYAYEEAYKTKDELAKVKKLENLLENLLTYKQLGENSTPSSIHQHLFEYYAKQKNEHLALLHARGFVKLKNPYLPKNLKEVAITLSNYNLALDTALKYAKEALANVNDYPFGLLRYFPAYGYIPSYVANKDNLIAEQKGEILSIIGSIYARQKKYDLAEQTLKQAVLLSKNITVYQNFAHLYEQTNRPKLAFDSYRKILLQNPVDSTMLLNFRKNYLAYNGKITGYSNQLELMQQDWEKQNLPKIQANKLSIKAPDFSNVFNMKGELVDSETLKGKIIIIDFWATWCVPCIEGFPYMQKVYEQFKDQKDVVFMITNSGSKNSLQDAQNWVKQNNFSFPFYYNDRKLAEAFGINTIPSTFLIDKTGTIKYKTVGFEGPIMQAKLALQIKDLIGGQ